METRSCDGKRELITLDLLGDGSSSVVVGAHATKTPFRSCHRLLLHPPELNLFPAVGVTKPAPPPPAPFAGIQSVCTIEQVKRALERAERESRGGRLLRRGRRRGGEEGDCSAASPSPSSSSSSSSSSITTGSSKRPAEAGNCGGGLVAAGCSGCLSYVLISADNPRCPRCESQVAPPPLPAQTKRPRIDLNFTSSN